MQNASNQPGPFPPRHFDSNAVAQMETRVLTMKVDPVLRRMAVLLVANCFRNTILENYHSEWPEFTDDKMKALMKEAVNRLHTALHAFFSGDKATKEAVWELLNVYFPAGWDEPEFDQGFLRFIELTKDAQRSEGV